MAQNQSTRGGSLGARLAGVVLLLLALTLLGFGVYNILNHRDLTASGRAEVLSTSIQEGFASRNRQDICSHRVRYVDGPDEEAFVTSVRICKASVGDVVTVHYDPGNPADAAFEGDAYNWGELPAILLLVGVLAFPGWILLRVATVAKGDPERRASEDHP
jgi:hypothetical protein